MNIKNIISKNIRAVPQRGVAFENADYPFLMSSANVYKSITSALLELLKDYAFDYVVGIEATGFPIAGALAFEKDAGLVMMRKFGKLPGEVVLSEKFILPYKKEETQFEIQKDIKLKDKKVLLFDEALDSGQTLKYAVSLLEKAGAKNLTVCTITNLPKIYKISSFEVKSLIYGSY